MSFIERFEWQHDLSTGTHMARTSYESPPRTPPPRMAT